MSEKTLAEREPARENDKPRTRVLESEAPAETLDEAIFFLNLWLREAQGLANGPLVRLLESARTQAEAERNDLIRSWRKTRMSAVGN